MVTENKRDSTVPHCHQLKLLSTSGTNLQRILPTLRRPVWQLSAEGFVWCESDSDLMWQQSSKGLVCSVVFIQTGITFIVEESIHLFGWDGGWRLSIAGLPSNSTFSVFKHNWPWHPISLSLAVCRLHHLVSSWITNGKPNLSASIWRRILAACLSKSFETYSREFKLFVQSDILDFLISFFCVSQQLCGM